MKERQLLEQEMLWLFGDDWRDIASPAEYTFALLRIQQRRRVRGWFIIFSILVTLITAYVLYLYLTIRSFGDDMPTLLLLSLFPLAAIVVTAVRRFPTARVLAKRERQAGQKFLDGQATKAKVKPKRGLALGDDGELVAVEVNSDHDLLVKAKHQ